MLVKLGLAGVAATVVVGLLLRGRESFFERHTTLAKAFGAFAIIGTMTLYAGVFDTLLPHFPRDPLIAGALFGLVFGGVSVVMALTMFGLLAILDPKFRLKIPDPRLALWLGASGVVACAVAGVLMIQLMFLIRWSGPWALLLVPFGIALFPIVLQVFKVPALLAALRRRQQSLEPACAGELREWTASNAGTFRIRNIEIVFGPKGVPNAAAVGFYPFTRFIMIGDGLTEAMTTAELEAILAHELAHVLRSDVRNQFLLWVALGSAWVYVSAITRMNLGLDGPVWAVVFSMGFMLTSLVCDRYARHCEFAADRLAGEMLNDPAPMRSALETLATLTKVPRELQTRTHPSFAARLAALS